MSANSDGPEIFGAHDRAQAVAPVEMAQVVGDAGVAHQVLARNTDLQYADFVIAQFRADVRLDFGWMPPPQVLGGAQFCLPILDPELDCFF